jgi:hypothetical protein
MFRGHRDWHICEFHDAPGPFNLRSGRKSEGVHAHEEHVVTVQVIAGKQAAAPWKITQSIVPKAAN